jgi:hypothetical protein
MYVYPCPFKAKWVYIVYRYVSVRTSRKIQYCSITQITRYLLYKVIWLFSESEAKHKYTYNVCAKCTVFSASVKEINFKGLMFLVV